MSERTIVIIIDALGHSLCLKHGFNPEGLRYRARLRTVLGFSQAALATIFSGRIPSEHGLWMMYSFCDRGGPLKWLSFVPPFLASHRRMVREAVGFYIRRIMRIKSYFSLYDIPVSVLPYLDLPARGDIFAPRGATVWTIFDELSARKEKFRVWDYRVPEQKSFFELEREIVAAEYEFLLLYTPALDAELHRSGCSDDRIKSKLDKYSETLERIVRLVGESGGGRIIVLGDHGICDVEKTIDVVSRVNRLDLRTSEDYLAFYDSTMARFRFFSDRARSGICECLSRISEGMLLGPSELDSLGVGSPDGRFGDIVFLAKPGYIISPSFMGDSRMAAMHGYHPDCEEMYSIIMSNEDLPRGEYSLEEIAFILCPDFGSNRRTES